MSKTVTMILATKVVLHDDSQVAHSFGPGICEVPVQFENHWYLKAHKAVKYDPAAKAAELMKEAEALEAAAALEAAKAAEAAAAEQLEKEALAVLELANKPVDATPIAAVDATPVAAAPWSKKRSNQIDDNYCRPISSRLSGIL